MNLHSLNSINYEIFQFSYRTIESPRYPNYFEAFPYKLAISNFYGGSLIISRIRNDPGEKSIRYLIRSNVGLIGRNLLKVIVYKLFTFVIFEID